VVVEDLNAAGMVRDRRLSRRIADASEDPRYRRQHCCLRAAGGAAPAPRDGNEDRPIVYAQPVLWQRGTDLPDRKAGDAET